MIKLEENGFWDPCCYSVIKLQLSPSGGCYFERRTDSQVLKNKVLRKIHGSNNAEVSLIRQFNLLNNERLQDLHRLASRHYCSCGEIRRKTRIPTEFWQRNFLERAHLRPRRLALVLMTCYEEGSCLGLTQNLTQRRNLVTRKVLDLRLYYTRCK